MSWLFSVPWNYNPYFEVSTIIIIMLSGDYRNWHGKETGYIVITDESYTDVELPLKPLLFHVLISRPYDVCPRAAP